MKNKEVKTIVEIGEYKGNSIFTIWSVNNEGVKSQYPLISVGRIKAKAIINHLEELKDFTGEIFKKNTEIK